MSPTLPRSAPRAALLLVLLAALALPASASAQAEPSLFHEETAEAFWLVPHTCADGSIRQATLLVRSTYDFETPDTVDEDPTARLQYNVVCPEGSFSWVGNAVPATITSTENLKSVTASGSGTVRDNLGVTHQVTFDVTYTGVGPLVSTASTNQRPGNINTSTRKQREATATGTVTFDGATLVDGAANHPTRAMFIRVDEERNTSTPTPPSDEF
jgi:hypothetical protein